MTSTVRYAAGSDIGRRRAANQDSAYTSPRLLAVADGMGGHAHGEIASAIAVAAVADLDAELRDVDLARVDLLGTLSGAVTAAARRLTEAAGGNAELSGTGTTLVAVLVDGTRLGMAHIGDSRAYLLRDGGLEQLTHDHTLVQTLVDEGRLTPDEAADHPRRSVLVRTLQEGTPAEPDLILVDGRIGDRLLICSDGVTAVVPDTEIRRVLVEAGEPPDAVDRLIALANERGGPDNITCVVADLVPGDPAGGGEGRFFGAAEEQLSRG